jgi:hypothetical protein
MSSAEQIPVERVQTGVRIEKRVLKVLKALAEIKDMSVGDLIEGIVLHAFEGKAPFGKETLQKIDQLRSVYQLDLDASASHRLIEDATKSRTKSKPRT